MPDRPTKLAFAPLLLAQALWVRRRALILPEPSGARQGRLGNGPPLRLLILGDSSAAGVGAETQAQALSGQLTTHLAPHFTVEWHLQAITGATTRSTLRDLHALPAQQFDVAVIALGVNDITHGAFLRGWLRDQDQMLDLLADKFDATQIHVCGLPPMARFPLLPQPLRWVLGRQALRFDAALQAQVSRRAGAEHIAFDIPFDARLMAPDGFHPGPEAYRRWGAALAQRIADQWQGTSAVEGA
jgi:lysophospholipase L1-like esterase